MNRRDIRGLDIGMLRTFDALMREKSVSRAAARLFLSQPAVSASLNRLREVFGDPLFTRTAHGVLPTGRALGLAPQVQKVLADLAGLLGADQPFDPASSNRIFRIAGSDHASRMLLPELSRTLIAQGSAIRLVWVPPGTWSLAEHLHQGELDLAVIARIQRPRDMETEVLYEDRYVYVMRKNHPRAAEAVTLDSFCEIPQVFPGYGTSMLDDLIDESLAKGGRQRLAQIAVTSFGQIVHQLQHSDHAAVLGGRVARAFAGQLHVQELPFPLPGYQSLLCWDAAGGGRWRHPVAEAGTCPDCGGRRLILAGQERSRRLTIQGSRFLHQPAARSAGCPEGSSHGEGRAHRNERPRGRNPAGFALPRDPGQRA